MAGLGLLTASAAPGTEAQEAKPQGSATVPLAKRETVQLEFETVRGLAYQVYSRKGKNEWRPLGQLLEGDGKPATVSYPGDDDGVEFRVETYEAVEAPTLPEGIDYKLTGIYRLRGAYKVCVAKVDRTTDPVRTAHFTLGRGDTGGSLRLLDIDAAAGTDELLHDLQSLMFAYDITVWKSGVRLDDALRRLAGEGFLILAVCPDHPMESKRALRRSLARSAGRAVDCRQGEDGRWRLRIAKPKPAPAPAGSGALGALWKVG